MGNSGTIRKGNGASAVAVPADDKGRAAGEQPVAPEQSKIPAFPVFDAETESNGPGAWGRSPTHPMSHRDYLSSRYSEAETLKARTNMQPDQCGLGLSDQRYHFWERAGKGNHTDKSVPVVRSGFRSFNPYKKLPAEGFVRLMEDGYFVVKKPSASDFKDDLKAIKALEKEIEGKSSEQLNVGTKGQTLGSKYNSQLQEINKLRAAIVNLKGRLKNSSSEDEKTQIRVEIDQKQAQITQIESTMGEYFENEKKYARLGDEIKSLNEKLGALKLKVKPYSDAKESIKGFRKLWSKTSPELYSYRKRVSKLEEEVDRATKRRDGLKSAIDSDKENAITRPDDTRGERLKEYNTELEKSQASLEAAKKSLEKAEKDLASKMGGDGFVVYLVAPGVITIYDIESEDHVTLNDPDAGLLEHGAPYGRCMPGQLFELTGKVEGSGANRTFKPGKVRLNLKAKAVLEEAVSLIGGQGDSRVDFGDPESAKRFVAREIQGIMVDYNKDLPFLNSYFSGTVTPQQETELKSYVPKSAMGILVRGVILAKIYEGTKGSNTDYIATVQDKAIRDAVLFLVKHNDHFEDYEDEIKGVEIGTDISSKANLSALQALTGLMLIIAHSPFREFQASSQMTPQQYETNPQVTQFNSATMKTAAYEEFYKVIPTFAMKDPQDDSISPLNKDDVIGQIRNFLKEAFLHSGKSFTLATSEKSEGVETDSDDTAMDVGIGLAVSGLAVGTAIPALIAAEGHQGGPARYLGMSAGLASLALASMNSTATVAGSDRDDSIFTDQINRYTWGDGVMDGGTLLAAVAAGVFAGLVLSQDDPKVPKVPVVGGGIRF